MDILGIAKLASMFDVKINLFSCLFYGKLTIDGMNLKTSLSDGIPINNETNTSIYLCDHDVHAYYYVDKPVEHLVPAKLLCHKCDVSKNVH